MDQEYNESTYGDRVANIYDHWHTGAAPDVIAGLQELAGSGPVLELGIGTGRLAGLRLKERWSDWQRTPFTAKSTNHISIYELP